MKGTVFTKVSIFYYATLIARLEEKFKKVPSKIEKEAGKIGSKIVK